jgi:hypothetical protein
MNCKEESIQNVNFQKIMMRILELHLWDLLEEN